LGGNRDAGFKQDSEEALTGAEGGNRGSSLFFRFSSKIILVEGCVLVEAKAVAQILPIHKAQLMSYLRLLEVPLGLLINFHELKLANGINRLMLPGANR
jgi:PD-(D/E)XK nuclease superfamily